jgi:hypothetical protein
MRKSLAFLLGSGISKKGGLLSVQAITTRILSGEKVSHHTDGSYYLEEGISDNINYVERVVLLLRLVNLEINRYFLYDPIPRTINYEHLYYLINQIHDSILGEYENPLVGAFLEKNWNDFQRIGSYSLGDSLQPWDIAELLNEAENYIRDVVWRSLLKDSYQVDYLKSLCDACLDDSFTRVYLFTLNHDTLLETALKKSNLPYNDGFRPVINGVRYWHPDVLAKSETKVRLIKLHGSIDWFSFQPNEYSFGSAAVGIPIDEDYWHTRNPSGVMQRPMGGRPVFLAGTFNKMLHYTSEIFADLYFFFRSTLRSVDNLVICGYGFGDKGINSQIVEWMNQASANHLLIIHNNPDDLKKNARGAIIKNWEDWSRQDRLSINKTWIEDTTWQKIKENLKIE